MLRSRAGRGLLVCVGCSCSGRRGRDGTIGSLRSLARGETTSFGAIGGGTSRRGSSSGRRHRLSEHLSIAHQFGRHPSHTRRRAGTRLFPGFVVHSASVGGRKEGDDDHSKRRALDLLSRLRRSRKHRIPFHRVQGRIHLRSDVTSGDTIEGKAQVVEALAVAFHAHHLAVIVDSKQ